MKKEVCVKVVIYKNYSDVCMTR